MEKRHFAAILAAFSLALVTPALVTAQSFPAAAADTAAVERVVAADDASLLYQLRQLNALDVVYQGFDAPRCVIPVDSLVKALGISQPTVDNALTFALAAAAALARGVEQLQAENQALRDEITRMRDDFSQLSALRQTVGAMQDQVSTLQNELPAMANMRHDVADLLARVKSIENRLRRLAAEE